MLTTKVTSFTHSVIDENDESISCTSKKTSGLYERQNTTPNKYNSTKNVNIAFLCSYARKNVGNLVGNFHLMPPYVWQNFFCKSKIKQIPKMCVW